MSDVHSAGSQSHDVSAHGASGGHDSPGHGEGRAEHHPPQPAGAAAVLVGLLVVVAVLVAISGLLSR
jgi:hypothetical protein